MTTELLRDRRAEQRTRTREAILVAARDLALERGPLGTSYGVDELAERADVSRRTVFNHFASLDEVTSTLCARTLDGVIDSFTDTARTAPLGDGTMGGVLDDVAGALRATDLVSAIGTIHALVGDAPSDDPRDQRPEWLVQHGFALASERLRAEVVRRNPAADPLDVTLLVESLLSGVAVVGEHWLLETGGADSAATRRRWSALLDKVIDTVRHGHVRATG
ncbi:TetR/AcrR family transcriptional regulator [Lapillicoccus jejuensis]|uniref:TetR family transcriptional regulator n=1 Tax=Lapillicoccus jejuensis TaxID=402171 RepID=A0A542E2F5_9MICO|nr:TetR/AcrR family transcriptional regulator [Lapillicoccus jejuensis]TQJ09511.1 TetR family transcriptional regulator [Lapillicoccus jejuensis]